MRLGLQAVADPGFVFVEHAADLADAAVGSLCIGSSGEVYAPPLSPAAWTTVGLTPEALGQALTVAEGQAAEIISLFLAEEA